MRFLWWILSLAIAGAIIYSLVSARSDTRNGGRRDEMLKTGDDGGLDNEFADDVVPTAPQLDNGIMPGTPFLNVDTAAAAASRGAGGIADEDEEYGATYPYGVQANDEDSDDDDSDDDDYLTPEDEDGFIIEGSNMEKQTYMNANDALQETTEDVKKSSETGVTVKKI